MGNIWANSPSTEKLDGLSVSITGISRQLGINIITESFGNPQMNMTQIVDGFTGLEHTMGLEPIYEDVIQLLKSSKLGITPTLVVVYNGPSGETYFHQTERLWENDKLLQFFRKDKLLRLRRPTFYWPDDHYTVQMGQTLKDLYDRGIKLHMGTSSYKSKNHKNSHYLVGQNRAFY